MTKLKIIRESDFTEVEVEFPKAMVELADKIAERYSDLPFIPTEEGKINILVVDEEVDRHEREITGRGKYIITIRKY
jgi:hypothetical protein